MRSETFYLLYSLNHFSEYVSETVLFALFTEPCLIVTVLTLSLCEFIYANTQSEIMFCSANKMTRRPMAVDAELSFNSDRKGQRLFIQTEN